ncbi:nucleotide-binding universal stress UspA family protein [Catalinimonas alkaloidigena]|uniref:universal stress protein n=1 Tax=Catalinimonas alkaloidigena TaxID=1075417 RepID=UPI002405887E|nr:universal stress protein [Catalinimonas alkaloidigena]MDF9795490.1 nucleotide-binding universal stress UspA family protein [Catalinimonas alkaloidigena]
MFKKLAIALAFSPRYEAILHESRRFQELFNAYLVIIHVGNKTDDKEQLLQEKLDEIGFEKDKVKVVWQKGEPAKQILKVCHKEKVDLLVAGAMKKENIFRYYIGSVARTILRKAECSVLVLIHPSHKPQPFRKIVINGGEKQSLFATLSKGVALGKMEHALQIHILREVRMLGLAMAVAGEEGNENQYGLAKRKIVEEEIQNVNKLLKKLDTGEINVHVKVFAGKPEFEIAKFSRKVKSDLLILSAPRHKLNLIDRIFPHDMEYLLADLPSNLLVVQNL